MGKRPLRYDRRALFISLLVAGCHCNLRKLANTIRKQRREIQTATDTIAIPIRALISVAPSAASLRGLHRWDSSRNARPRTCKPPPPPLPRAARRKTGFPPLAGGKFMPASPLHAVSHVRASPWDWIRRGFIPTRGVAPPPPPSPRHVSDRHTSAPVPAAAAGAMAHDDGTRTDSIRSWYAAAASRM
jgi:hypothetical protein